MKRYLIALGLAALTTSLAAQEKTTPKRELVSVTDAWVRAVPPSSNVSAAYMTIQNDSDKTVYLESAKTSAAKSAEIHRMARSNGMMTMDPVDNVPVPAGGKISLEPGGYHLMLIGLKNPLRSGGSIKLSLRFRGGRILTVVAPIRDEDAAADKGASH